MENKQETLEEAAEKWYDSSEENKGFPKIQAFIAGTQWQAERMYSEEDMIEAIMFGVNGMYGLQIGEEGYTDNQIKRFLETFKIEKL